MARQTPPTAAADDAARLLARRQLRQSHPDGSTDTGGRWYPSDSERRSCCSSVRAPSRAWPWSYMVHCRTLKHVAQLTGVDAREIRRSLKQTQVSVEAEVAEREAFRALALRVGVDAAMRMEVAH